MNYFHTQLWHDLMQVVQVNTNFSYKDVYHVPSDAHYRLFNYRLAKYTDWLVNENTFNCRGTMFEIIQWKQDIIPITLVCLPPKKFFNIGENLFTIDLDLSFSNIQDITLKYDGSLISTFIGQETCDFYLKTKGSLESQQAVEAMTFLDQDKNIQFKRELHLLTACNYTVNMEYTAPTNRVVLGYTEPNLSVFQIRDIQTGQVVRRDDIEQIFPCPTIVEHWIESRSFNDDNWIKQLPSMTGIEGVVVELNNGTLVKAKTDWYLTQHRAKDEVNIPRRLFEIVLDEASDDFKSLLSTDPFAIKLIEQMELTVAGIYKQVENIVESYYNTNKHLDRKSYAIKGQQELEKMYFGLAITMYLGKPVDYKEFLKKHYRQFGINDSDEENSIGDQI